MRKRENAGNEIENCIIWFPLKAIFSNVSRKVKCSSSSHCCMFIPFKWAGRIRGKVKNKGWMEIYQTFLWLIFQLISLQMNSHSSLSFQNIAFSLIVHKFFHFLSVLFPSCMFYASTICGEFFCQLQKKQIFTLFLHILYILWKSFLWYIFF